MIKQGYSKDHLVLRTHNKEKNLARLRAEKKKIQSINERSKKNIKYIQENRKKALVSPLKKKLGNLDTYMFNESPCISKDENPRFKIIKPIEINSKEYESEIQQYLGVNFEESTSKAVNYIYNRSKSSFEITRRNPIKSPWEQRLKQLDEEEKQIQKSINELDRKHKLNTKYLKPTKSFDNIPENDSIVKSLQQINILLLKVLDKTVKKNK